MEALRPGRRRRPALATPVSGVRGAPDPGDKEEKAPRTLQKVGFGPQVEGPTDGRFATPIPPVSSVGSPTVRSKAPTLGRTKRRSPHSDERERFVNDVDAA